MLPIIYFDGSSSAFVASTASHLGRSKRRSAKPQLDSLLCSQQSILTAMDRFVKSVNNMHSTVLVPSKLRDMEPTDLSAAHPVSRVPSLLSCTDLHGFYVMLNDIKRELMWGPPAAQTSSHEFMLSSSSCCSSSSASSSRSSSVINRSVASSSSSSSSSSTCSPELKARRQTSNDSLGSSVSSISSDTESDADSMITDRDSIEDQAASHLAVSFRHHLQGLNQILQQLADSADYLSSRYQQDIEEYKL